VVGKARFPVQWLGHAVIGSEGRWLGGAGDPHVTGPQHLQQLQARRIRSYGRMGEMGAYAR
jgi:hypothetical protein